MIKHIKKLYNILTCDLSDLGEVISYGEKVKETWFSGVKSAERDVKAHGVSLCRACLRDIPVFTSDMLEWSKGYSDYLDYFENNLK